MTMNEDTLQHHGDDCFCLLEPTMLGPDLNHRLLSPPFLVAGAIDEMNFVSHDGTNKEGENIFHNMEKLKGESAKWMR